MLSVRFCLLTMFAAAAGSAALGVSFTDAHYRAKIATLERDAAQDKAAALGAVNDRLTKTQALADGLEAKLLAAEKALVQTQERSDAIRKNTTGRACLSAGAVRLLNDHAITGVAAVPAPAAGPYAADGAFSTDTAVGLWIDHAWRRYEVCRGRLAALIDFEEQRE